ncbi:carboxypeptidase-like regulatory domain-containing protein [Thermodesulfobacteriota bacterium]
MSVINDGEIFARIHKFKMFRKEGNLFIDVYEALLGKPAHKFIAVPNLLIQEADKRYFGFGDTKAAALKDCFEKIKGVSIHDIVPSENHLDHETDLDYYPEHGQKSIYKAKKGKKKYLGGTRQSLGIIHGVVLTDPPLSNSSINDIITAREENPKGVPIKNAKIIAVSKGAGKRKTQTDDSGYYELTGLKDGLWMLKLKARGFETEEATVEISGGGVYEENF